MSTYTIYSTI